MSAGVDLFVIDPEFCFPGPPEFDLAVFLAHTRLANLSPSIEAAFFKEYTSTGPHVSEDLVDALTSVEILRRLLGVAQLPLKLDLSQKRERIEAAIQVLKGFSVL